MFGPLRLSYLAVLASLGACLSVLCLAILFATGEWLSTDNRPSPLLSAQILFTILSVFALLPLCYGVLRDLSRLKSYAQSSRSSHLGNAQGFASKDVQEIAKLVYDATLKNRSPLRSASEPAPLLPANLAEAFTSEKRALRDLALGVARFHKGDLHNGISSPKHDPFPPAYDDLRINFNALGTSLANGFEKIGSLQQLMKEAAQNITGAAQDLSNRSESQSRALEHSSLALGELTANVKATAQNARTVEAASRENHANAESGAAVVREAIQAMQGIEHSSSQITRIIGVIDDIAFQTNLLALNAGVEAARAGEAGRGFAVVASEVRGLAQRASESAKEIKMLISKSGTQVTEGAALVNRAGESLALILEKAGEVSSQITAIAQTAADQSSGLAEINTTISQFDQVTQKNAQSVKEAQNNATRLIEQTDLLRQELTRLGATTPPPACSPKPASKTLPKTLTKAVSPAALPAKRNTTAVKAAPRKPAASGPNKFIEF